ncbi:hypothetical protein [Shewanella sediminis]|uniref:hypothetical protein n=1 Tax=Shewanella sediminis TaxID=271097 RepID=UPI0002DA3F49|nr:hypothetical protein [Shewanella sediminis]
MKKFEGLWVSALLSAAAPLAEDSPFHQSQKQSADKSGSVKLNDKIDAIAA